MLNRIIDVALSARWIVLMLVIALVAAGGYALYTMPVEAFSRPHQQSGDGRDRSSLHATD